MSNATATRPWLPCVARISYFRIADRAGWRTVSVRFVAVPRGFAMMWLILIAVVVVLLAVAFLMDVRSRRIRGHALTMRLPSRIARRSEAQALMSRRVAPADWDKYRVPRPGEDIPKAD